MIEKKFKNEQAIDHLNYALTCGFFFEKFTYGRDVYGNRVSLIRPKDPKKLYTDDCNFKSSDFHSIEGIKALEIPQTIIMTRQKLEAPFTDKECIKDFLSSFSTEFMTSEDLDKTAEVFYDVVGKKLLSNKITDFNKLNSFVIGNMVLNLPLGVVSKIAEFRQRQVLDLLTQDIITADDAQRMIRILPKSKEELVVLRQKLLKQRAQNAAKKAQAQQDAAKQEEELRTGEMVIKKLPERPKNIVAVYRAKNASQNLEQMSMFEEKATHA